MHAIGGQGQGTEQFHVAGAQAAEHVAGEGQEHDDGQRPATFTGIGADPGVSGNEQVDQRTRRGAEGQGIGDLTFAQILFRAQGKPQQQNNALHWRKAIPLW
ncbi:hypothetical protein D3C85_1236980 [compost metagenome]